ncbi:unnamed protein product [Staurois parvus]|uniref:Uncharacterized protein n=1 Tax=Staurois parvus TaxID=386267 RepID=A0ABN9DZ82_9NEOB|nr:unnamed protein product [Staurois parvus]
MGPLCPCPHSTTPKKAYEKGTRGISWGPLLTSGPLAVLEFPNGQSAPACAEKNTANPTPIPLTLSTCNTE